MKKKKRFRNMTEVLDYFEPGDELRFTYTTEYNKVPRYLAGVQAKVVRKYSWSKELVVSYYNKDHGGWYNYCISNARMVVSEPVSMFK